MFFFPLAPCEASDSTAATMNMPVFCMGSRCCCDICCAVVFTCVCVCARASLGVFSLGQVLDRSTELLRNSPDFAIPEVRFSQIGECAFNTCGSQRHCLACFERAGAGLARLNLMWFIGKKRAGQEVFFLSAPFDIISSTLYRT